LLIIQINIIQNIKKLISKKDISKLLINVYISIFFEINKRINKIYKIYSKSIPHIGEYITGKSEPYEYLIKSIDKFYNQNELSEVFKANGFDKVEYRNLSGGIVAIHSGWKI